MKQLGLAAVESQARAAATRKARELELHNGLELQSQLWVESMLEITIKSTENGKVTPSHGITNAVPCIYENTAK